jgi:hypothetical protein
MYSSLLPIKPNRIHLPATPINHESIGVDENAPMGDMCIPYYLFVLLGMTTPRCYMAPCVRHNRDDKCDECSSGSRQRCTHNDQVNTLWDPCTSSHTILPANWFPLKMYNFHTPSRPAYPVDASAKRNPPSPKAKTRKLIEAETKAYTGTTPTNVSRYAPPAETKAYTRTTPTNVSRYAPPPSRSIVSGDPVSLSQTFIIFHFRFPDPRRDLRVSYIASTTRASAKSHLLALDTRMPGMGSQYKEGSGDREKNYDRVHSSSRGENTLSQETPLFA